MSHWKGTYEAIRRNDSSVLITSLSSPKSFYIGEVFNLVCKHFRKTARTTMATMSYYIQLTHIFKHISMKNKVERRVHILLAFLVRGLVTTDSRGNIIYAYAPITSTLANQNILHAHMINNQWVMLKMVQDQ